MKPARDHAPAHALTTGEGLRVRWQGRAGEARGPMTLEARAWLSLLAVGLVMAALVFAPAGTIDYWQAWVYLALFLGAGAAITAISSRRTASCSSAA